MVEPQQAQIRVMGWTIFFSKRNTTRHLLLYSKDPLNKQWVLSNAMIYNYEMDLFYFIKIQHVYY